MPKGYVALVLHAHLPFIKHPEHESFLEERWLFEAVTDTYIPLIDVFDKLIDDGVDFRITVSLSPTLISMLKDELLISRYLKHLDGLITLAGLEVKRTRSQKEINELSVMYLEKFKKTKHIFCEKYSSNITRAFKKFQDLGKIEVITSCATHGYLPLMDLHKPAVKAQIKIAVNTYEKEFGVSPKGMWLPECAYHPGHEEFLGSAGIEYFFVETHGILFGKPRPRYGVYSPYICEGSKVAVLGRDEESSKAVWSSKEGYPGNAAYRDYYRDIGFDLDHKYIRPFIDACGTRVNTGIKYCRITGETDQKETYDRRAALSTAASHAGNFMFNRAKQAEYLADKMDRVPIIVSPYDAELFGHWWFEGPQWLDFFLRKTHYDQDVIKTITPSEYLKLYDSHPVITPSESSWGWKGYSEVWLDGSNDWIYRHLHKIAELMIESARKYQDPEPARKRVLNQMARELLLAQSSDWAFIMKTGTFYDYAAARVKEHVGRFLAFYDQLEKNAIDLEMLKAAESVYSLFEDIDYKVYA